MVRLCLALQIAAEVDAVVSRLTRLLAAVIANFQEAFHDLVRQEESQQFDCRIAPPQPHQSPDDANFIGRITRRCEFAAALPAPLGQIQVERPLDRLPVNSIRNIQQVKRVRSRRRIEVRPLDAAWNEIQVISEP